MRVYVLPVPRNRIFPRKFFNATQRDFALQLWQFWQSAIQFWLRLCCGVRSAMLIVLCLLATVAVGQTRPVIVLIATGGTIAMKIDPVKRAPVPAISGEDLLAT